MTSNTALRPADPADPADPAACGCPENRQALMSRRTLFRMAGAAGLVTATTMTDARLAFGAETGAGVLVGLFCRGGIDGLQVVVPNGDPNYARLRPGIGIPAARTKKIDETFGLHPALAPLFPLWDAGQFGAVHAVGQSDRSRSHFQAMEELERAAPGTSVHSGFVDRLLGVVGDTDAFAGTHVGSPTMPRAYLGEHSKFAMSSIAGVKLTIGEDTVPLSRWRKAVTTLHTGARPEVARPLEGALASVAAVRTLDKSTTTPKSLGYPDGQLGAGLHDVARLVKATVGLRVATVDFDGFDMHSGMGTSDSGEMFNKLTELGAALAAFAKELGSDFSKVTLMTFAEFGRRVEQNGSGGTDHGHGNAVLVLGGGINGGTVHGRWPGLGADKLMDGDLAGTTDYRSVVSEVLTKRCGVPSTSKIFPGFTPTTVGIA
jgi:uncharacterized protein (DUF1501 family)